MLFVCSRDCASRNVFQPEVGDFAEFGCWSPRGIDVCCCTWSSCFLTSLGKLLVYQRRTVVVVISYCISKPILAETDSRGRLDYQWPSEKQLQGTLCLQFCCMQLDGVVSFRPKFTQNGSGPLFRFSGLPLCRWPAVWHVWCWLSLKEDLHFMNTRHIINQFILAVLMILASCACNKQLYIKLYLSLWL